MAASHPTLGSRVPESATSSSRIPSLDGLRAVSIALVVYAHLIGTVGFPKQDGRDLGTYGVRFFFVISGFLITGLLLKEYKATGTINLRRFTLRRTFRIFPAYYASLLVLAAISAAGWVTLRDGDLLHALTYTQNYHADHSWWVGHAWSLSVEEQFYLLWPAAMMLAGTARAFYGAAAFVVLAPFIRTAIWVLAPAWREHMIGHTFETVADAIAIGCVLAGTRDWLWERRTYRAVLQSKYFVLIPILSMALYLVDRPRFHLTLGITGTNICIALCLDWCLRFANDRVGRFLNWAPLVYIGTASYSIYLWQQFFLNRETRALVTSFPLNLVLMAVCALLSYYAVERPWLNWRPRVEEQLFGRKARAHRGIAVAAPAPEQSSSSSPSPMSI
jgi:peptidoglycan/LPS O-acetylase OafA/YrhL